MKVRRYRPVYLFLSLLSLTASVEAHPLSSAEQEVQDFMKKLYSYDPATFEYGEFNKKDSPGFEINQKNIDRLSKYIPDKNVYYYPAFLIQA